MLYHGGRQWTFIISLYNNMLGVGVGTDIGLNSGWGSADSRGLEHRAVSSWNYPW